MRVEHVATDKPVTAHKGLMARSVGKSVQVRCTGAGELLIHQTNSPGLVGNGVNQLNKDGMLVLGSDGSNLRNLKVKADGTLVTTLSEAVKVTVLQNPLEVLNMPESIRVTPDPVRVIPFSFNDGHFILPGPFKVVAVHVCADLDPMDTIEVVGLIGEVHSGHLDLNLSQYYVEIGELEVRCSIPTPCGGCLVVLK